MILAILPDPSFGRVSRSIIEDARKKRAKSIGAGIGEIFLLPLPRSQQHHTSAQCSGFGCKRFISSLHRTSCVLHTLQHIQNKNVDIEIIWLNVNRQAKIDLAELQSPLSNGSSKPWVSLMYRNNEISTIHDIEKVGNLCQTYETICIVMQYRW